MVFGGVRGRSFVLDTVPVSTIIRQAQSSLLQVTNLLQISIAQPIQKNIHLFHFLFSNKNKSI
jgi:hypothetical protein